MLGANGQLGTELVRLFGDDSAVPHSALSITDEAAVDALISSRKPEVVFNCAAYNAVDRAESEEDAAFAINADGPGYIARSCQRHGAWFVHFSTNFVFDGSGAEPYVETDTPAPLSVYGSSKLAGEQRALEAGTHVVVVRTAAVFGSTTGRSFPERIVQRARAGEKLRVVSDQTVNPTFARDLAAAAVDLAEQRFAGVVHAVADGCAGWDDFARAALMASGVDVEVESITTGAFSAPARRPANGCLDTIRYHRLRPWQEAVSDWAKNP
ncbi:MAG TPA: dTDP-4-dehydrorhamnose reductase [Candidatus Dormibacteraeota bacterium]|nr:dTDP-4-dehydrorhamnose reductase [Candidatus Dormibacteraeota bacterium]